jgi:hypothetical protein
VSSYSIILIYTKDSILISLSSWVTGFFKAKFGLSDGVLGTLFFVTSIIAAASMLVASSISKRIGNIKVSQCPIHS